MLPCILAAAYTAALQTAKQPNGLDRQAAMRLRRFCGLEVVRPAGFRRLHPLLPDWAALRAATEQKPKAEHADDQSPTPPHADLLPLGLLGPRGPPFQAAQSQHPFQGRPFSGTRTLNRGKEPDRGPGK